GVGRLVLSGHRPAAVERFQHLRAHADHRRRLRHLVVRGRPRGPDARPHARAGQAQRAHPRRDALRAVRKESVPLLRGDPKIPAGMSEGLDPLRYSCRARKFPAIVAHDANASRDSMSECPSTPNEGSKWYSAGPPARLNASYMRFDSDGPK